jgi:A/G-specific adenine glycosylase
MIEISENRLNALRRELLDWFDREARSLPWRRKRTIYGTWLAEIMLQQTTVAVVEPYWNRFLERFPTVEDLGAAAEEEVLSLWSGLGYYSRARNLLQAARQVVAAGSWPQDRRGWRGLPGVGAYTSAAVVSQALGQPEPALDANARRVLTRWLIGDPSLLPHLTPSNLEHLAHRLVPETRPGDWNEAVMELGALVCRARTADCENCPVLDHCNAGLAGRTEEIPGRKKRAATRPVWVGLLAVLLEGKVVLVPASGPPALSLVGGGKVVRSDFGSLHPGLWSLPSTAWLDPASVPEKVDLVWSAHPATPLPEVTRVGRFQHAITRYRLEVDVFLLKASPEAHLPWQQELGVSGRGKLEKNREDNLVCLVPWDSVSGLASAGGRRPRSSLADKALEIIADNFC